MTPYPSLPLIFVATGVALLAAAAYLTRLVRRHRRSLGSLLKLAKIGLDPLQIPAAAWTALAGGGIRRLDFSGSWFGQPVQGAFGTTQDGRTGHPFAFQITANDDVWLDFQLYAQTDRGEARLFAENLAGVFHLLLETTVRSKMEALSAALAEQARLTLYLQHDLRNLAQWVEWLAADFADAQDDEALLYVAQRLGTGAPHAAARARRILDATCKTRTVVSSEPQSVELAGIIRQAAEHAGIPVTLDREAYVFLSRDLLDRTLDNLFANVAPLLRQYPDLIVAVAIAQNEGRVSAKINIPRLAEAAQLPPEKLFEPFASGRPGGLGLGLYQAHKSLAEAGGWLAAQVCEQHICFSLSLPGTKPAQV
jgi:signal transduction histidine kinase